MTVKALATGVATVAAIGAAAAGVTSVASGVTSGHPAALQVQPVVFGTPVPLDQPPAPNPPPPPAPPGAPAALPTADQLSSVCNSVTNPGVGYTAKNNFVQGGFSPNDGTVADHDLRKAYRDGNFPQQYNVTNIQPAGPNAATADVAISGPKFAGPVTKNLQFVNEGGNWVLSHDSALALVQAATSTTP
ncbi:MAG: hypothetical protein J2P16_13920 [Mycobacterium sp.]|nr:hypothetical protein [Mycobacterium sp.]